MNSYARSCENSCVFTKQSYDVYRHLSNTMKNAFWKDFDFDYIPCVVFYYQLEVTFPHEVKQINIKNISIDENIGGGYNMHDIFYHKSYLVYRNTKYDVDYDLEYAEKYFYEYESKYWETDTYRKFCKMWWSYYSDVIDDLRIRLPTIFSAIN